MVYKRIAEAVLPDLFGINANTIRDRVKAKIETWARTACLFSGANLSPLSVSRRRTLDLLRVYVQLARESLMVTLNRQRRLLISTSVGRARVMKPLIMHETSGVSVISISSGVFLTVLITARWNREGIHLFSSSSSYFCLPPKCDTYCGDHWCWSSRNSDRLGPAPRW